MIDPDSILLKIDYIGKQEVIEQLHSLYNISDKKDTRKRILEILNQLNDNNHFNEIENYFLSDVEPEVRIEAAKILAFCYNKKKAIIPLIWVYENEDNIQIKYTALRLLVSLGHRRNYKDLIVKNLKEALKSKNENLVGEAAESLGILKEQSAVDELIEILYLHNPSIKIKAIRALGEIQSKRAIPDLICNLSSPSINIWRTSLDALINILGDDTTKEILKILKVAIEKPKDVDMGFFRKGIIKTLGELKEKNEIKLIIKCLGDFFYWVRWEAVKTLDKIEPKWREKYKGKI